MSASDVSEEKEILGTPYILQYMDNGRPRLKLKSGGFIMLSATEAIQFEICNKLNSLSNEENANAKSTDKD